MIAVPPDAPANLKTFFQQIVTSLQEGQQPTFPHPLYRTASTTLPSPIPYTGCVIDLTDLNTIAKSDGAHWRRVDTGVIL